MEQLPAFDNDRKCANVIIETPRGSSLKYSYQPASGTFYVKRILPPGMVFPFNFGFIPSTLGQDGDPVDILLLNEEPAACGCLLQARLLAVVKVEQAEGGETFRNDRLVGCIRDEESPDEVTRIEFNERRLAQIRFFFSTYNEFSGKEFKILGTGDSQEAERLVREGQKNFQNKK